MERLRQAEAEALKDKPEADASDAGLGAMRAAIAATKESALRTRTVSVPAPPELADPRAGPQRAPIAGWQAWSRPPGVRVFGSTRAWNQGKTGEST